MIHVRTHGTTGPLVIVLHGGPAAVGEAAPIARGLADRFRVLEPWQRGSGREPLTVARHIADLHEVIVSSTTESAPEESPAAIVGESWGAMLALAYTAAHPKHAGRLALIGCGTFDTRARARMKATLEARTTDELRHHLEGLRHAIPDPGQRLQQEYEARQSLYDYAPLPPEPDEELPPFDLRAHTETWQDMLRLQAEGLYPAAFARIDAPAVMLHGAYDPHPGRMIHASLKPILPQLEYHEWERCGHSPWREKWVRDDFFAVLRRWLERP